MKRFATIISVILFFIICIPNTRVNAAPENPDAGSKAKPQVIVKSYKISDGNLTPGSECTLNLELANTSEYTAVNDLVITYVSNDNTIYPIYGESNQIYVKKLAASSTANLSVHIKVSEETKAVAQCALMMEYRGDTSQIYTNSSQLFIPITGRGVLRINELSIAKSTTMKNKTMLSLNYGNYGNTIIRNIVMHISGNIDESQKEIKLNDLEVGNTLYQDYYVTFTQPGNQQIKVSFTYQDENNNTCTLDNVVLETTVAESNQNQTLIDTEIEDGTEEQSINLSSLFLVVGILIIVILIMAAIIKRIRKK